MGGGGNFVSPICSAPSVVLALLRACKIKFFFLVFLAMFFFFFISQICELDHCFLSVWDLTKCVTAYWHKLTALCSCADQTFHFLCCLHHSHNGGFYRQKGLRQWATASVSPAIKTFHSKVTFSNVQEFYNEQRESFVSHAV